MDGVANKSLEALSAYPIVQGAVGIAVILAFVYVFLRATKDKAQPREMMPTWLLMGPLHDMMQSVDEVAEQGRESNDLLRRIEVLTASLLKEVEKAKAVLEDIRNNSELHR